MGCLASQKTSRVGQLAIEPHQVFHSRPPFDDASHFSLESDHCLVRFCSKVSYQIVSEENPRTTRIKSVEGRELLEMLEEALKESDPADLEEDAKYTQRLYQPTIFSVFLSV